MATSLGYEGRSQLITAMLRAYREGGAEAVIQELESGLTPA